MCNKQQEQEAGAKENCGKGELGTLDEITNMLSHAARATAVEIPDGLKSALVACRVLFASAKLAVAAAQSCTRIQ